MLSNLPLPLHCTPIHRWQSLALLHAFNSGNHSKGAHQNPNNLTNMLMDLGLRNYCAPICLGADCKLSGTTDARKESALGVAQTCLHSVIS
jgi:hypothetical protein